MALDPQARRILDVMGQNPAPLDLPLQQLRAATADFSRPKTVPEVAQVKDIEFPGVAGPVRARVYNPNPQTSSPQPALIYIHGGGWCLDSIESHDSVCRGLANQADLVVFSIDYRLAPEHPFPAGLEDCYTATQWICSNAQQLKLEPTRIALGGDSAGGNLTAAVLMLAHQRHGASIAFQLLLYPCVHMKAQTGSRTAFARGYVIEPDLLDWVIDSYGGGHDSSDPLLSPLLAADLSFMPPALIVTAGHDMLRDEGKQYADLLQQQGVKCIYKCYEGLIHGFMNHMYIWPLDMAEQATAFCAKHVKDALNSTTRHP
ncbi:TPA: hypothetical protein ACH3X2_009186 [Trebouxia sp. C0005]